MSPLAYSGELRRALIVDDEAVLRTLITRAVESFGFDVLALASASEGAAVLDDFDPDIVLLDLALGDGESGLDLLSVISIHYPWIAVLIVSSHRSPDLVGPANGAMNASVGYILKSEIVDIDVLAGAIESTLASQPPRRRAAAGLPVLTRGQAAVLRLMADGLSNTAIAAQRGCSLRALERTITRLYTALGVGDDAEISARVRAVTMYRDGRVDVR